MARRYRLDAAIIIILLLVTAGIFFFTIRSGHDWGGDFSMYIIHARNLAQGRPYFDTGYLLDPEIPPMAPSSYPPFFPLLLAPLYKAYGLDYHVFKVLVQALFLPALLFTYLLARLRGAGPWMAGIAVAVIAWSGIVLQLKESVLSESAYLTLAGGTLCLALWIYRQKWDERFPAASAMALTLLVLLAYATRVTGLSLALALLGFEIVVTRKLRKFNLYLAAGLLLGIVLYTRFLYDGRGYGNQFGFTPHEYIANALYYLRAPAVLWGGCPWLVRWPLTLMLITLACVGFVRALRRLTVTEFYIAASILPLILYSSGRADRYLLPILPFLPIYASETLTWLRKFIPVGWGRMAMAGVAAVVLTAAGCNIIRMDRGPITEGVAQPSFEEMVHFVRGTPASSRFIFWNPRVLALYTNRESAWYAHTTDTARFLRFLDRMKASYVILYGPNEEDAHWLRPHIESARDRFTLAYRNGDFEVYQILKTATAEP